MKHVRLLTSVTACLVVVVVPILSAIGIAVLAPRMAPVRLGSSHLFWKLACGVNLSPEVHDVWGGDAFFVDDTWAAYSDSHMHGSAMYYVATSDVLADFDAVVTALQRSHEHGEDSAFIRGYIDWRDDDEQPRSGAGLLESIGRARKRQLVEEDVDLLAYVVAEEQLFWQRWQRANWYWASILFEWVFLSGLVIFVLWPVIRNRSVLRCALHVGLLPLLFLLPTYLGYATYSFTSAGPSGGVLYPYLLVYIRGGTVTALDSSILAHLPQVLEPLSTPIGSWMALTGMGMPGPTSAIIAGVLIGGLIAAISLGYGWWLKRDAT